MAHQDSLKIVTEATKVAEDKQDLSIKEIAHTIGLKYQKSFSDEQFDNLLNIIQGAMILNRRFTKQLIVEVLDLLEK
ncbi:MAG: hypothetical protein ABF723_02070 [Lentilactobacillus hilgardii]|uniref:hypothetical protein n=1 Tax=Lactobacillaceae TaxID=33958 RepID=UPI001CC217A3|nr:hypothetical protein [Lentilactobacillus hilgardii]MBZ2201891.1 hypothetical protein [Lentilactobacillus hilgardii]MBZ2204567.1 hypothetical protein [Lentilactobacillus hilgardii]